ncbi:MAG: diacylglycerol kinase family protein [bacterium]
MDQVLTCILNNKAGSNSARNVEGLVARIAAQRGWQAIFPSLADGIDLKAVAGKASVACGLVVAGGGDGTIAAVASALVGSTTCLGVLPMGTLNHFAKDVGIPLDLEEAVQTLFTGKVTQVDVGEVNGHIFLNNSSIGFYPRIVVEREREQRHGRSKWTAFVRAAALVAQKHRTMHVELDIDNSTRQSYETPFVFIGNNRYKLAGTQIGTRASLDGGKLWVCAAPNAGRGKMAVLALEALLGLVQVGDLPTFESMRIDVNMHLHEALVATDGEVKMMRTPLHYRSRPRALRVLIPAAD